MLSQLTRRTAPTMARAVQKRQMSGHHVSVDTSVRGGWLMMANERKTAVGGNNKTMARLHDDSQDMSQDISHIPMIKTSGIQQVGAICDAIDDPP